jgi:hypothetical protein
MLNSLYQPNWKRHTCCWSSRAMEDAARVHVVDTAAGLAMLRRTREVPLTPARDIACLAVDGRRPRWNNGSAFGREKMRVLFTAKQSKTASRGACGSPAARSLRTSLTDTMDLISADDVGGGGGWRWRKFGQGRDSNDERLSHGSMQ